LWPGRVGLVSQCAPGSPLENAKNITILPAPEGSHLHTNVFITDHFRRRISLCHVDESRRHHITSNEPVGERRVQAMLGSMEQALLPRA
jgi:hypothetical protein